MDDYEYDDRGNGHFDNAERLFLAGNMDAAIVCAVLACVTELRDIRLVLDGE